MDQKQFSEYVINGITVQFPQLKEHCIIKPNGVIDVEYSSRNNKLILWLTTQDKEITIGLSGNHELGDFHTHMSLFGANTPKEELIEAINLIKKIINDEVEIIYSSVLGYFLGDIDETEEYRQPGELISINFWSSL